MAYYEFFIIQDNPAYLEFCEEHGFDPWAEYSELEYWDQMEDRFTNPHG